MKQTYFKASIVLDEDGTTSVWFDEWHVIRETKCFVICVRPWVNLTNYNRYEDETPLQQAKRHHISIKRIHKQNSRFAFATKELAFERLKFIKHYHVRHLQKQLQNVEQFLEQSWGKSYAEYEKEKFNKLVPLVIV